MEECDRLRPPSGRRLENLAEPPQSARKKVKTYSSKFQERSRRSSPVIFKLSQMASVSLIIIIATISAIAVVEAQQPRPANLVAESQAWPPNEFQLSGQAGGLVRLPCLIGKQAHCGEPYFIAWYKQNATSRQWTRIEARSPADDGERDDQPATGKSTSGAATVGSSLGASRPLVDRVQFTWSRAVSSSATPSCYLGDDSNQTMLLLNSRLQQRVSLISALKLFDCAQLAIRPLELQDEGQYKCEITFSESVEFDRCPASTMTQLNVIARPNEPEILLNGRAPSMASLLSSRQAGNGLTFKEGAQVRLECQSAGGKPAPRIEWLNLTTWTGTGGGGGGLATAATTTNGTSNSMKLNDDQSMESAPPDDSASVATQLQRSERPELVQLMRLHWPIKRATYSVNSYESAGGGQQQQLNNNINQIGPQQLIPVTSSSITITLSRFDVNSRFACLVLPQTAASALQAHNSISGDNNNSNSNNNNNNNNQSGELQMLSELPAQLRDVRVFNRAASQAGFMANTRLTQSPDGPMLKWIQLGVLAKPTSVSIRVLELQPDAQARADQPARLVRGQQQAGSKQPFYSLEPNRLYAIQCLVENSRPRSQVAWFNRTAPLELAGPTLQLDAADYLIPSRSSRSSHRLSSFVRYVHESTSDTFSTISTLLLTTDFSDNFQELFCRVSNEAFQFDELVQVAPIISARIYVNYSPTAWLEAPDVDWTTTTTTTTTTSEAATAPGSEQAKLGSLSAESGRRVQLRCMVGANPLPLNTIVQIDWLKDGRRLSAASNATSGTKQARLQIEKANHLHMPLAGPQQPPLLLEQLGRLAGDPFASSTATSVRLLTSSSLTISELAKTDAGLYTCQFKLIPAPSSLRGGSGGANVAMTEQQNHLLQQLAGGQQQQQRIMSGQASRAIQLTVIEAKLPVVRISSANGLFVYGRATPPGRGGSPDTGDGGTSHHRQRLEVVVPLPSAQLSLKCYDRRNGADSQQSPDSIAAGAGSQASTHRILWYLNGAFVHSSQSDLLLLRTGIEGPPTSEGEQAADLMKAKLASGNGGRLSCARQTFEAGASLASPGNFHAQSMRLFPSSNEIDLRFKVEPRLLATDHRRESLMPHARSFSELELAAQPLNRLKLTCLAQCEPICSIGWLLNKRPLSELEPASSWDAADKLAPAQVHEIADNQTSIFKSARRLDGPVGTSLMEFRPDSPSSPPLSLLQVDNFIHRVTASSSERFPWYRQTSLVPAVTSAAPEVANQAELAGRQLMRDSYELANWLANTAASAPTLDSAGRPPPISNVFSKLELSYNQIERLLASKTHSSGIPSGIPSGLMQSQLGNDIAPSGHDTIPSMASRLNDELLVECKLVESFGGGRNQFGSAHVANDVFYPYLKQMPTKDAESPPDDESSRNGDEQQSDLLGARLDFVRVNLTTLLVPERDSTPGGSDRQVPTAMDTLSTRIVLEKKLSSSVGQQTGAPSLDELLQHPIGDLQKQLPGNSPIGLNSLLVTNNTNFSQLQLEDQLKFLNGQLLLQQQQPVQTNTNQQAGTNLTPIVRNWFVGYQERILVGASALVLVWLLVLFVSPLIQRRLASSPKLNFGPRNLTARHQNKTTNWRFNRQQLSSRASSTNEIGAHVNGNGGGSSSSSSSMMAHKFGLHEPPPTFGFGMSAPNYYGPVDSNGPGDSSEQDMIQSCSQSSNYEDFIQHQIQQRLHQQPLYFNQAHLIESTTLSRRPLMPQATSEHAQTSARHHHQNQSRSRPPLPSTMRHNLSNVPLISGVNSSTSRINFNDLQRHPRESEAAFDRYATGKQLQRQRQQHSFGHFQTPNNSQLGPSQHDEHLEHIYDDVS